MRGEGRRKIEEEVGEEGGEVRLAWRVLGGVY